MDKRKEFGKYIRSIRGAKGLSQHKISRLLGYKSNGTINAVEQGITSLPIEKIHSVARICEVPLEEILEKLKECEPEIYLKYTVLAREIEDHFVLKIRQAYRTSSGRSEVHPFREMGPMLAGLTGGMAKSLHNTYYQDINKKGSDISYMLRSIYIMSTFLGWSSSTPEKSGVSLPFLLPSHIFREISNINHNVLTKDINLDDSMVRHQGFYSGRIALS